MVVGSQFGMYLRFRIVFYYIHLFCVLVCCFVPTETTHIYTPLIGLTLGFPLPCRIAVCLSLSWHVCDAFNLPIKIWFVKCHLPSRTVNLVAPVQHKSVEMFFSSPQSSQVVGFLPAPSGKDGRSDLIAIAKRFGEPLYSLFLPSKVSRTEHLRFKRQQEVKCSVDAV